MENSGYRQALHTKGETRGSKNISISWWSASKLRPKLVILHSSASDTPAVRFTRTISPVGLSEHRDCKFGTNYIRRRSNQSNRLRHSTCDLRTVYNYELDLRNSRRRRIRLRVNTPRREMHVAVYKSTSDTDIAYCFVLMDLFRFSGKSARFRLWAFVRFSVRLYVCLLQS